MEYKNADTVIGYSGLDLFEECYEYCENACYIADTPAAAEDLMKNSFMCTGKFRIDPVTIKQIMSDYGSSCGEFAMELAAFDRFKVIAAANGIRFDAKKEDYDVQLMVVDVEGVTIQNDW